MQKNEVEEVISVPRVDVKKDSALTVETLKQPTGYDSSLKPEPVKVKQRPVSSHSRARRLMPTNVSQDLKKIPENPDSLFMTPSTKQSITRNRLPVHRTHN